MVISRLSQHKRLMVLLFAIASGVFFKMTPASALAVPEAHTEIDLVPEYDTVKPGMSFYAGINIHLQEGWHVYWKNPGDSGLEPRVKWQLPAGFEAGAIEWPYPERFNQPPLTSYGYTGDIFLPLQIKVSSDIVAPAALIVRGQVSWLVCNDICVPAEAELSFPIAVRAGEAVKNQKFEMLWQGIRDTLPLEKSEWEIKVEPQPGRMQFVLSPPEAAVLPARVSFFPEEPGYVLHSGAQSFFFQRKNLFLEIPLVEGMSVKSGRRIKGVLVSDQPWIKGRPEKGLAIDLPVTEPAVPMPEKKQAPKILTLSILGQGGLLMSMLFAFLGGLILNLMPCVLPVLSLKIMGLLQKMKGKTAAWEGLQFSAGVVVCFWALAFVLLLLRFVDIQVGWGFQFQSPIFLACMALLFFYLGLNLFGVFEVGLGLGNIEAAFAGRGWAKNPFFHGMLATVVATPCTAPFMGSAIGVALSSSVEGAFLIFSAMGIGMALPYFVLSCFPGLLFFLPKPGPWMMQLKRFFGFLFMGTVVWLASILGMQQGAAAISRLMTALLFLGFGSWIFGEWGNLTRRGVTRFFAFVLMLAFFAMALGVVLWGTLPGTYFQGPLQQAKEEILWKPYSADSVEEALREGSAVFIDFTAAWCLSCQANEALVFRNPAVIQAFAEMEVEGFKADWTRFDPEITKALASYGKASVPLYVYYAAGSREPKILPEIITPQTVLDALRES